MGFPKEYKDLLIQLYNKEVTRNEYNCVLNNLYDTKPKVNENKNQDNVLVSVIIFLNK
ncbi:hypothetical protein bcere0004_57750 [Bacillus cereus BGSC 6E1]|nr:hypothetical protein bcere0004_57750 [Bacillus cereus BGSC 6E1]